MESIKSQTTEPEKEKRAKRAYTKKKIDQDTTSPKKAKTPKKQKIKAKTDIINTAESRFTCEKCGKIDKASRWLVCEQADCDNSEHIMCMKPPLIEGFNMDSDQWFCDPETLWKSCKHLGEEKKGSCSCPCKEKEKCSKEECKKEDCYCECSKKE